jgi:hypothetical protein
MKSWYESKTIWLGMATIVTAVVSAVAGTRRLRGHDEAGATLRAWVAPEVGDPEVVAVADLPLLVHARQAEWQARVALDALGVHQVHVGRRIGHHEVALAGEAVLVLVDGRPSVATTERIVPRRSVLCKGLAACGMTPMAAVSTGKRHAWRPSGSELPSRGHLQRHSPGGNAPGFTQRKPKQAFSTLRTGAKPTVR